jgi:hypothetical protein
MDCGTRADRRHGVAESPPEDFQHGVVGRGSEKVASSERRIL